MKPNGIELVTDSEVYPPSDDTYLLLDAIELGPSDSFLEIGCGSGLLSVAAARTSRRVVATDISLEAVRNTRENLIRNSLDHRCSVIQSDLLSAIDPNSKFSIIAFNPPYLPKDEHTSDMDRALVGGTVGVEMTERFLSEVSSYLESQGSVYVVASSLADLERVEAAMLKNGLRVERTATKRLFFEILQVLRGTP
ncbi:MAG: methyltransferase [Candidatus Thorarchaeota archaeon]|nr:MAG: methyltransferase [Candidatus Thorarchaeota archaeon]